MSILQTYTKLLGIENKRILILVLVASLGVGLVVDSALWWYHGNHYTAEMASHSHQELTQLCLAVNERVTQLETEIQKCCNGH